MNKEYTAHQFGSENAIRVLLPEPDKIPETEFVGREELVSKCMAAWLTLGNLGSLHFRLSGPPGVGKNELIYHLGREIEKKPVYIMQGHDELAPEDIACTARLTGNQEVEYVGSPLLAAMVHGGICFFDEIGKVPSRSLSLLAPVLDERRSLTSVLAGFTQHAHPEFRFCAAMNDTDADVYGLPGYIDERLRPAFKVDFPPVEEVMQIVSNGVPGIDELFLDRFKLKIAGRKDLSPREALNVASFAIRMARQQGDHSNLKEELIDQLLDESFQHWSPMNR